MIALHRRFFSRLRTYKTYEQAKRSFYKWACKEGLYQRLRLVTTTFIMLDGEVVRGKGRFAYERSGGGGYHYGTPWRYGHPIFLASRSEAMRCWERVFACHWERWVAEAEDRTEALRERTLDLAGGRSFFKLANAAAAISKL